MTNLLNPDSLVENERMPKKIIVVGMNRSGTKWLSNLLVEHSKIISVQKEDHNGMIETNMFGSFQNYFMDLRRDEEYVAFMEMWSQTDFFKSTLVDKEYFYSSLQKRNFLSLFNNLMNKYASNHKKEYWLQKTSPVQYYLYAQYLNPEHVIIIERNYFEVILSTISLSSKKRTFLLLSRFALSYIFQWKVLQKIKKNKNTHTVYYDNLLKDEKIALEKLFENMNIPNKQKKKKNIFKSNSTWNIRKKIKLTCTEKILLYLLLVVKKIPFFLIWFFYKKRTKWKIVPGTFRQITSKNKEF